MNSPLIENVLRVVLATSLLAATTLATSSVVHSHCGGRCPHDHDPGEHSFSQSARRHSHPAADDHRHHDHHAAPDADQLHRHVYLVFLGSAMTLPGPEESDGPHRGSHPDGQLLFAVPLRNQLPGSTGNSSHLQSWSTSVVDQHFDCNVVVEQKGHPVKTAPIPFLCDRARHERSGVLLA